jgi:hypothetical protein
MVVCFLGSVVGHSRFECSYYFIFYIVYFLFVPFIFSFNIYLRGFVSDSFILLFFRVVAFVLLLRLLKFLGVIVFVPLKATVVSDSIELSSVKASGSAAGGGASAPALPKAKPIFSVRGEMGGITRYELKGSFFSRSSSLSSSRLGGSSLFGPMITRPRGELILDSNNFHDRVSAYKVKSSLSNVSVPVRPPVDLSCLFFAVPVITVGLFLFGISHLIF